MMGSSLNLSESDKSTEVDTAELGRVESLPLSKEKGDRHTNGILFGLLSKFVGSTLYFR